MPGGDVGDAHALPRLAQPARRARDRLHEVLLADANASPADRIEVAAVDQPAEAEGAARFIAIDVIERAAGIEAGREPETHAFRQPAERAHRQAHRRENQPLGR